MYFPKIISISGAKIIMKKSSEKLLSSLIKLKDENDINASRFLEIKMCNINTFENIELLRIIDFSSLKHLKYWRFAIKDDDMSIGISKLWDILEWLSSIKLLDVAIMNEGYQYMSQK